MRPRQFLSLFSRTLPLYFNRHLQRPISAHHQAIAMHAKIKPRFKTRAFMPLLALAAYSETNEKDEWTVFQIKYAGLSSSYQKLFRKLGFSAEEVGAVVQFHQLLSHPLSPYHGLFDLKPCDENEALQKLVSYFSRETWGPGIPGGVYTVSTLANGAHPQPPSGSYFYVNGEDLLQTGVIHWCKGMLKIAKTFELDVDKISGEDAVHKIADFIINRIDKNESKIQRKMSCKT